MAAGTRPATDACGTEKGTGMLIIEGSLSFKAEDRDDVLASLREVTARSRQDAGCIEYWWAEDLEQPDKFRFFECWETQELFDRHIDAPHEKAFGERNLSRLVGATARIFTATPSE
jgi:quinol monooxygenase YgiN